MAARPSASLTTRPSPAFQLSILTDEINGAIKDAKDPLSLKGGPITRANVKKMREILNGLIEDIQAKQGFTDALPIGRQQVGVKPMSI